MKQTVKTSRAAGQLEKMFRELNKHYFAGKLPEPKIAIDTFLAETSECKASGCAVFSGADIAFQDIQLHTHRNKSEMHFMAGHTMLSIPLASILSIEKLVLRDIQSTEYEIITKESGIITLDVV